MRFIGMYLTAAMVLWAGSAAMGQTTQPDTRPAMDVPIEFNFKDATVDTVLNYLSSAAGYTIHKESSTPIPGLVNIINAHPILPEQAVQQLETELRKNGYTAVEMGTALKIETLDEAKKADIPVLVVSDPSTLEASDRLITAIIPVTSIDATKLKNDIQPLINTDADLTSNEGSNSLMITDTSANVRRVVEIVSALDKHEATQNTVRVWQLKYADAQSAAALITSIFNPPQENQSQGPTFPFSLRFGGGGGGGGPGGQNGGRSGGGSDASSSSSSNTGKVTASSDERTNTVVVSGPQDTLKVIDAMLTQLDANPATEQTFFIYHVENGQALDMQTTLNGLFSGNTSGSSNSNTNRTNGSNSSGNGSNNRSGGGNGAFGGGSGGGGGLFGSSGGSSSSSIGTSGIINRTTNSNTGSVGIGNSAAASNMSGVSSLIGQVYVVADQDTNSLLVATATKYEDQVKQVILELDRPVPQVLIKCLVAEVTHVNSLDLGVDFSVLNTDSKGNGEKFVNTLGAAAAAASTSNPAGMVTTVLSGDVSATIQALAQESKLDVLSRPYILTSDNQEADVTVGDEIPFVTNSQITSLGNTINTIEYQDIGIILDVTPHINPEGLVIMTVNPQISSLTGETVTITTGVAAPVIELRLASTVVGVRDGQTIVIGGLMQDQKTVSVNKVPILGDIPLLGLLFQYSQTSKTKTELLIFLTPHVAQVPDRLKEMSDEEIKSLKLTPDAVQPGTFQEHMRGMSLGGTDPSSVFEPTTRPSGATTQPTLVVPAPTPRAPNQSFIEPALPGGH